MKITYHPYVTVKLIYDPPYWSKKLDREYGYQKVYEAYQIRKASKAQFQLIAKLANINIQRALKNKLAIKPFFQYVDFYDALNAYDFIHYFCVKHSINPKDFFIRFSLFQISEQILLSKVFFKDAPLHIAIKKINSYAMLNKTILPETTQDEFFLVNPKRLASMSKRARRYEKIIVKKLYKIAEHNFLKVVDTYNKYLEHPYYYPYELLEVFYEKSFEKAIQNIGTIKTPYKYRRRINLQEVIDDIENFQNITRLNKKIFRHGLRNQDQHFIGALLKDRIEVELPQDGKKPLVYFKKFSKSLSIGYYAKGLFIANEKVREDTIKELEELLTILQKFNNEEAKKQIEIAKAVIDFLKQNAKYKNYIPFKALAKYSGFKASQIKELVKKLMNSKAPAIYINNKDKIKLPPLKS